MHRELVGAYTTAAVKNHSMNPPEDGANPLDFMPSHRASKLAQAKPELSEEELERLSDFNVRVAELAIKLKEQARG